MLDQEDTLLTHPHWFYQTWEEIDRDAYEDAQYLAYTEQYDNLVSPEREIIVGAEVVFPSYEEWIGEQDEELTRVYPNRPLYKERSKNESMEHAQPS